MQDLRTYYWNLSQGNSVPHVWVVHPGSIAPHKDEVADTDRLAYDFLCVASRFLIWFVPSYENYREQGQKVEDQQLKPGAVSEKHKGNNQ